MADRHPYDGIAEGASVACREPATSIVPTPHRGMTDRFPYDGIAKGASVACHETATSIVPTPQPHPPTRMSDYAFG